jgi:hypothetical protein
MKIRSLLLGSVAAAGLSTGAFAADLGVLTSLDVCDALGLSGLTISSDTNCLQISGGVSYEFSWGDYEGPDVFGVAANTPPDLPNGVQIIGPTNQNIMSGPSYDAFTIATPGAHAGFADRNLDWSSKIVAWLKFVGTADSDFGPAKAVIKIHQKKYSIVKNEGGGGDPNLLAAPAGLLEGGNANTLIGAGSSTGSVVIDEAYVSVGDSTVLMAGKKSSIMNVGSDEPLNFLGLFYSEKVDKGVKWRKDLIPDGGASIQIVSDLGNGVSVGAGLENLDGGVAATGITGLDAAPRTLRATASNVAKAGTAVGVISYAGDGIAAHLTVAAGGILDGVVENWGYHAGFAGTFDIVKFVAALAGDNSGYWNALASASATFDMFTLAISGEAVNDVANAVTDYGFGGSISAAVTDGVTINLGGRWYHDASGATVDSYQVAAQLVAAVTETITLTGEVGVFGKNVGPVNVYYGAGTLAWAPGGGFTSSIKGEAYSNGAYKATFKAAKTFE